MQNQIIASMAAFLAVCLSVPANARVVADGMENGISHQEPAPAGQDRQETAKPAIAPAENNAEAEKEYAAGRAAMRRRDWKGAIQAFKRTVELNPDYRDARQRLAEARTILNNEEIEAVAARYYDDGVAAMNRNDFDGALDAFEKVNRINRRYRDLEEIYARLEGKLPKSNAPDSTARPAPVLVRNAPPTDTVKTSVIAKVDSAAATADSSTHLETAAVARTQLDSLYQQALAAFERDDWKSAVIAFERIKFAQPNYRDLDDLAAVARVNLLRQTKGAQSPAGIDSRKILLPVIITVAVAIMGGLGFGLFVVSSAGRARFYRWRGNDVAAALLYEKLIAQRPNRIKLYPALAEIYLRLKRQDATARRIFQRVLALNLPTPHRAELHAIIAQQEQQASRKIPAPRKPRKKKEGAAAFGNTNGVAAHLVGANGALANGEFKLGE